MNQTIEKNKLIGGKMSVCRKVMLMTLMSVGILMLFEGCVTRTQQEFCYERVIVTLTEEAGDAAILAEHVFTPADFPEVSLAEVNEIGQAHLGMKRFFELTLENPGRRNVLRAVDILNKRHDVYHASLFRYYEGT